MTFLKHTCFVGPHLPVVGGNLIIYKEEYLRKETVVIFVYWLAPYHKYTLLTKSEHLKIVTIVSCSPYHGQKSSNVGKLLGTLSLFVTLNFPQALTLTIHWRPSLQQKNGRGKREGSKHE